MARTLATEAVPFLLDLAVHIAQVPVSSTGQEGALQRPLARQGWRTHIGQVFPHAERGIRSFMLTCMAEGHGGEDEADKDLTKGPEIVCKLSLDAVHASVTLRKRTAGSEDSSHMETSVIRAAQPSA